MMRQMRHMRQLQEYDKNTDNKKTQTTMVIIMEKTFEHMGYDDENIKHTEYDDDDISKENESPEDAYITINGLNSVK